MGISRLELSRLLLYNCTTEQKKIQCSLQEHQMAKERETEWG